MKSNNQGALEEIEKMKSEIINDIQMRNKEKDLVVYILTSLKYRIINRGAK